MAAYVTFAQVAAKFTPRQVREAFTDDGSAAMNQTAFDDAVAEASGIADAILAKAWPDPVARAAMAADPAVNGAIRSIVMALGAQRKPEWRGADGRGIYDGLKEKAEKQLERIAAAGLRPAAEAIAGANPNVGGSVSTPESPQFVFAPSASRPKPGGY